MSLISLNLNLPTLPETPTGKQTQLPLGTPYNLGSLMSLFGGVRTWSGSLVTPQTAMRASAVLACMRILSEDIASLPLNLYRRPSTGAILATDDPRFRLLHDVPNNWQTAFELREAAVLDMIMYGQCFNELEMGRDGITALCPLSAGRMVFQNPLDEFIPPPVPLFFRYADPRVGQRIITSDTLHIVRMLSPASTIEGTSLILLAREAIGLLMAAEEQGARLFSQGTQTDLVLSSDAEMDQTSKDELRDAFMKRHSGSQHAWLPMLLENGLKASRIGLTAQESQYLETRQFQTADIARIFRIPDVLLGIQQGKTATFASAEQFFLSYVKYTLGPWCRRFEQAIQRDLVAPSETDLFVKFDLDSLTRADLQTRYSAHASGIAAGFLTRNEARAMENLPTLPGLDEPLAPLNMGSGKLPPAQGAGAIRIAQQLARNCVAHEEKLLADGKPAPDVYTKLLPGYLRDKAGLSTAKCAEYCSARLAGAADGMEMLTQLLIAG